MRNIKKIRAYGTEQKWNIVPFLLNPSGADNDKVAFVVAQ